MRVVVFGVMRDKEHKMYDVCVFTFLRWVIMPPRVTRLSMCVLHTHTRGEIDRCLLVVCMAPTGVFIV